ncbi:MFS transporter [Saccharothrix coeruleofusca]|uniref:MFS transporter n=1 Tax=Saccharothrix coeruleofusca TaxID=33919 RepID=A0A918AJ91_9PSEU|nr:MFS transporter [Saccharothrix coeruleofusca]MBP2333875.1 MFS family permease [Saccharothrix coeruleofusca]GGP45052.1 MFS transporter [Saccharothrix coeruleofusca]
MLEDAGATKTKPRLPSEVWVLVAASFIIAIGFGIVAPVLPAYANSFNVGSTAVSVVISAFAFVRLVFAPVSGRLVSKLGETRVYITGILIVAVGTGACGFATAYWQLVVLRSLSGVGSTMFTVAAVGLLIRITPAPLRGRASGLWATGFLLGNIAGPLVGGLLVGISIQVPFVTYAVALFIAAFVVWWFLRNSAVAAQDTTKAQSTMTVRTALKSAAYRASLLSSFANGWAVFGLRVSLVPLFVVEVLHSTESVAGISMSVFALGNAVVLTLSGWLSDTIGRKPLGIAGLVFSAVGTTWFGFSTGVLEFMIASLVAGLGAGLLNPPQNAVVADVIGPKGKGGPVLAGFQMAADSGAIVGPLLAGVLADNLSYTAAFTVTGGIMVIALVAWLFAPETLPRQEKTHVAETVAGECGTLDEGPELPVGERLAGRPRQPDA